MDRVFMWVAWHLPKRLVYWCYIRGAAGATARYPDRTPHEVSIMDALEVLPR